MGSGAATPTYAASSSAQFEGALLRNRSLGQDILPSPGQPKRTESLYVTPGRGSTASGGGGGGGGLSKVSLPTFTYTYIFIYILYLLPSWILLHSLVNPCLFRDTFVRHFRVTRKGDLFFFFFFDPSIITRAILVVSLSLSWKFGEFRKEKANRVECGIGFWVFFCKTIEPKSYKISSNVTQFM